MVKSFLYDDTIINATCAIILNKRIKGTGWLVNKDGYILTAGHLLGTSNPLKSVEISFNADKKLRVATKVAWEYDQKQGIDFAILKAPISDLNILPLPIVSIKSLQGSFKVYGFGKSLRDISVGQGIFLGFYDRQNNSSYRLFKLDSKQIGQRGYSGGAIISEEHQAVVAIQISATANSSGAERDTVLAMPIYRILERYKRLNIKPPQDKQLFPEPLHENLQKNVYWGEAPDISMFFGRTKEIELLESWILEEHCKLIAILGIKGVGKTKLSIKLGKGGIGKTNISAKLAIGIEKNFDYVIWKKLLNAPPISEVLNNIIQIVSNQEEIDIDENIDKQISRLLHYLKKYRCLLIFDNFESVLSTNTTKNSYKKGYDGYGKLLKKIGEVNHQSCILLTSREKPLEISQLEGATRPVRSFPLKGLNQDESKQLINTITKLSGQENDWNALVNIYNGNPLALELVSKHIDDVFFGDIHSFLNEKKPIFNDLRDLLDWHHNRLSNSEKEILYWLAINREPLSYPELREDILLIVNKKALPSTLQSLQRKLPLEKSLNSFFIQPVLIEYLSDKLIENISDELLNNKPEDFFLLKTYSIIKASSKEYIRESQIRLHLTPIVQNLLEHFTDQSSLIEYLTNILIYIQNKSLGKNNYLAGNILNILIQLDANLANMNFSNLSIWQVNFQGKELHKVNFEYSEFKNCLFTQTLNNILSMNFNIDGSLLATSDTNGEIRIWDFNERKLLFTLKKHFGWAWNVIWHPQKNILASCSIDSNIKLWDLTTKQCYKELKGHQKGIWSISFSSNGEYLASAGEDTTVRIWNITSGECINILYGHSSWIWSIAFSPDSKFLATGSDDHSIKVWNPKTGECITTLQGHTNQVKKVLFTPNSKNLISSSRDNTVKIWDLTLKKCIKTIKDHSSPVRSLAITLDGRKFATGSDDQTIRLWSFHAFKCLDTYRHSGKVRSLKFTPDTLNLVSGGDDQSIKIWDINTGKCTQTLQGYTSWIWDIKIISNGKLFITASEDKTLKIWDFRTKKCIKTLQGYQDGIRFLNLSFNGSTIVSGSEDQVIKLWHQNTTKQWIPSEISIKGTRSASFSPDEKYLVTGGEDGIIRTWNIETKQCIQKIDAHKERIRTVSLNPEGNRIISCSDDSNIYVWDFKTGNKIHSLTKHKGKVRAAIFSPNGKIIISASEDYTVCLWDNTTGHLLKSLEGHTNCVYSVATNLTGNLIASCGLDRTIKLWDIQSGECLYTLRGHTNEVLSIAFHPTENIIISVSQDESIRFWNTSTGIPEEVLLPDRPYENMDITGAHGLTEAETSILKALGAKD